MSIFTFEKIDNIAIVTMDDPSQPQNVLNMQVQADYEAIFTQIEADASLTALIFKSGKPGCFLAGADISMLQGIETEQQAYESCHLLHAFFQRIVDLPITTVAAIDGVCLGGGLEISLAFDYRVASTARATKIGVPEVQLGILPGGGGTQRIPRLIDLPSALDLLLTGKQLSAVRAKKIGLVDSAVEPEVLMDVARRFAAKGKPNRKVPMMQRLMKSFLGRKFVIAQARKGVMKATKGKYPAPLKILDVVNSGLGTSLNKGLDIEARGFSQLLMTPESSQFVNIFFATTDLKKDTGVDSDAKAVKTETIGVLGAGLMGAGIAYVSMDQARKNVRLKDIVVDSLAKGVAYTGKIVDKKLARRRIKPHQRQELMSRLTSGITYDGLEQADVVIEAVFESVDLKQKMVADIEALQKVRGKKAKPTIFATNTSAIPIDAIAAKAKHPERIVGMHYFSPVEKMPLLEVVTGSNTADWVTATAVELGKQQGKTVIVVNDGPGFYTTRVLVPYNMEAVRMVLEGVSIEDVDSALEKFGMPVGPIKLMDEVGIDVGAHIVVTLNEAFGDRIPLIDGVNQVLEDDRQGRKNNRGFYDYSEKSKGKQVDMSIYDVMGMSRDHAGSKKMSSEAIAERVVLSMLNEAAYCLEEGILRSARDGDIGAIFGLGFPPFLGGPFRYMDSMGIDTVLEKLSALEKEHGERFAPAPSLGKLAKSKKSFYS